MRRICPPTLACGLALLAALSAPVHAQQGVAPRPSAPQPDPAMEAAQHAFDALPEAERKAIQDDLIWASDFNATLSGSFGPRTFGAIRRFEALIKSKADGILDEAERKLLADTAKKSRAAAKFTMVSDTATGSALGLPLTLFTKRESLPMGSMWSSKDDAISVRTGVFPGTAADLPRAYEGTLSIDAPGRKVTYKLLRPDFFVVSGEIGPRTFYTRSAPGKGHIVSYTMMFPTARAKEFDRVMIALANSFQPVAGTVPAAPPAVSGTTAPPAAPQQTAGTLPAGLILTGIVIGTNKVVTDALAGSCADLRINQKPARLAGQPAGGVAMLDVETGRAPVVPLASAGKWPDAPVVIGYVTGKPAAVLNVSSATALAVGDAKVPRIEVPLHAEGGGSAVLDRAGNLVGLMRAPHQTPRLVAGMVPAATHPVANADAIRKLSGSAASAPLAAPLSAGDLAAKFGPSLVPVECAQPVALPKS